MSKRVRQYVGLIVAIVAYYVIHEGAHFLYAVCTGTFKQINFMGLGIQINVFAERMTATQMGIFCILGSVATMVCAYALIALIPVIAKSPSKVFKACTYYVTIAMLLLDPLYLSLLCGFFGGGDMNGISLLVPEVAARIAYAVLLAINAVVFMKIVLSRYKSAFSNE